MSKRAWLIACLITGALAVGILAGILLSESRADATGEWGKALLTLFVAILISGLLTLIVSDYSRGQQQRDHKREQALNWLRSLVEANNRLQAAILLLNAQQGAAATDGEQIRTLIEVRVALRSLQEDVVAFLPVTAEHVEKMIEYLTSLGDEYRSNYFRLAWAQRVHEEFLKRQLNQGGELPKEPAEDPEAPWLILQKYFPRLVDLLGHGEGYKQGYSGHYHDARETLKKNLMTLSIER